MSARTIVICVPSRGTMSTEFVTDFTHLVSYSQSVLPKDNALAFFFGESTYIHRNRQDLAEAALLAGATHLLWIDDDMRFRPDVLIKLLQRQQPIVGLNYPTRGVEATPVAIKTTGVDQTEWGHGTKPERLYTEETDTGIAAVQAVGFGCVLIEARVFLALEKPWFENYYDRLNDRWVGEDVDFCLKAGKAGFPVYVDQEMSQEVGHIGRFVYTHDHCRAIRDVSSAARKEIIAHGA